MAPLQKEISDLQAEFNQKSVVHQLNVRKLFPENFDRNVYGQRDGYHGGYCWY